MSAAGLSVELSLNLHSQLSRKHLPSSLSARQSVCISVCQSAHESIHLLVTRRSSRSTKRPIHVRPPYAPSHIPTYLHACLTCKLSVYLLYLSGYPLSASWLPIHRLARPSAYSPTLPGPASSRITSKALSSSMWVVVKIIVPFGVP